MVLPVSSNSSSTYSASDFEKSNDDGSAGSPAVSPAASSDAPRAPDTSSSNTGTDQPNIEASTTTPKPSISTEMQTQKDLHDIQKGGAVENGSAGSPAASPDAPRGPETSSSNKGNDQPKLETSTTALKPSASTEEQTQNDPHEIEKRGAMVTKCVSPDYPECRGGEALEYDSFVHIPFSQANNARLRGEQGQCEGLVRETMRRVDRNTDPLNDRVPTNIFTAVQGMRADIRHNHARDMYDRIDNFQNHPNLLGLDNYGRYSTSTYLGRTDINRDGRINDFISDLPGIPADGMGVLRIGIGSGDNLDHQTNGHTLLIQRFSDDNYMVYDPNNGVFMYQDQSSVANGMRNYLDTAFNEGSMVATPDSLQIFTPRTNPNWTSTLPTTVAPPAVPLPEPRFALQPRSDL
ncbi:hypothetical protein QCE63_35785 [Caballeronia sp. LZ065]|uniref:hypothetical protein n=1 Tax=Caballeronia sp. LZ065 TaxID=3038571 RepID=UPI00285CF482|nr:hypothetical protein [Caballeronia sp. LZ065]MDR5784754.1 hypothetical protein [Caballeronia sp. LZ065]